MSIEEKYDEVRQLINVGKEKGYLLYDEWRGPRARAAASIRWHSATLSANGIAVIKKGVIVEA